MPVSLQAEGGRGSRTALVLSAGGGFGAYQAGAWRVLSEALRPQIVIGASIGSLNGWAIAGHMPPEDLCAFWRGLEIGPQLKFRLARPRNGFLDGAIVERVARDLHARYPAQLEYGAVTTEWRTMRPRLHRAAEITWRHLYASCAIPLVFEQPLLDGRRHADGGLLGALPLWAADEFDATDVVAIDVWRLGLARLQTSLLRFRPKRSPRARTIVLTPSETLGSAKDSLFWKRRHVDRWMALGEQDARHLIVSGQLEGMSEENISVPECFERQ